MGFGTMVLLTKLIAHRSSGKCTLLTALGFVFAYTTGRRAPVSIFCCLASHCSTLSYCMDGILRSLLYGLFFFFFCKRISRQWSHELCIFKLRIPVSGTGQYEGRWVKCFSTLRLVIRGSNRSLDVLRLNMNQRKRIYEDAVELPSTWL